MPAQRNVDMRLLRRFRLGAKKKLEAIVEAFNLLNSTNVSGQQRTFYRIATVAGVATLVPQQNLANPRTNFGADQAALDGRVVQLAVKVTF